MKYPKDLLESVVKNATNYSIVCRVLRVKENTGSHSRLIKQIKELGLDTSHFTGSGWSKDKELGYRYPLDDYLSNKRGITSWKLKNRLFYEEIFEKKCSICTLDEWLGEEMPLELDHINGNKKDNSLTNLRIICPNCHSKTVTYKSKNRKSR